ncbi:MAG: alpha-galactosidase [Dehalococcoidia bacterium]
MSEVRVEQTGHGPAITNGQITVRVHLNKGAFDVLDATGRAVITDAAVSVSITDGPTFTTRGAGLEFSGPDDVDDTQGEGIALMLVRVADEQEPDLSFTITLYKNHPFAIIQGTVQNTSPAPVRVRAFHPLDAGRVDLGAPMTTCRFYKQGWQSWSPTLVLDCTEDVPMSPPVIGPGTQPAPREGRFTSDLVTAVVDPASGRGVVAGFISTADQFSQLWLDRDPPEFNAASHADAIEVARSATLSSERLLIDVSDAPIAALERYGNALGREMEALPFAQTGARLGASVASGWCSWYYYFQGISEAEVMANLEYLAANRDAIPVDVVQIDDGYQAEIGDWLTPNEKFPHGMKWLADEIHARGFKAGLWLAPFLAGARSRLFQEHPGWFVKYSTGMPAIATVNWSQPCFALDLTHPEVQAWQAEVFRTILDDWGYDYVKIDFIFAAAVEGVRHDPNMTRAQAYRRGLEIVRDAAGERFVLACGNPIGPSVGLVDAARIGPDVAPYWLPPGDQGGPRTRLSEPSAINSIRNTMTRWWMHGRLWMNDPDCLLVRATDTALAGDEVRALATVIGLTGGMVLDSDKLPPLTPERRDIISLLLPVYGKSATPTDLFAAPGTPERLRLDLPTHTLLAVFNWDDAQRDESVALPAGAWHVFELWAEEYLGVHSDALTLPVPPHGCRLLRLTPDLGRPQVVGSTLHLLQGALEIAAEDWDGEKLRIHLRPVAKKDGVLWIARDGSARRVDVQGLVEERVVEG